MASNRLRNASALAELPSVLVLYRCPSLIGQHQNVCEHSAPRVVFDAVAPQVLRFLSVLRGANARAGEAFALREICRILATR